MGSSLITLSEKCEQKKDRINLGDSTPYIFYCHGNADQHKESTN